MDITSLQKTANKIRMVYEIINKISVRELEEFIEHVNRFDSVYPYINPIKYDEMCYKFREAVNRAKDILTIKENMVRRYEDS